MSSVAGGQPGTPPFLGDNTVVDPLKLPPDEPTGFKACTPEPVGLNKEPRLCGTDDPPGIRSDDELGPLPMFVNDPA
jgi:hypothetical protein